MLLLLLLLRLFFFYSCYRCAVCFVLLCFACSYLMFSLMYAHWDGHIKRHSQTKRKKNEKRNRNAETEKNNNRTNWTHQTQATAIWNHIKRGAIVKGKRVGLVTHACTHQWNVEMLLFWNALPVCEHSQNVQTSYEESSFLSVKLTWKFHGEIVFSAFFFCFVLSCLFLAFDCDSFCYQYK